MNAKGTLAALACASMVLSVAEAATAIRVDSVTQRWPWNNKVDITYTIADSGQDLANGVYRKLMFEVNIPGKASPVVIDGSEDVVAPVKDGTYTGSAQGFNGPVTVRVVIKDGKIKSVSIVSNSDTPSYRIRLS